MRFYRTGWKLIRRYWHVRENSRVNICMINFINYKTVSLVLWFHLPPDTAVSEYRKRRFLFGLFGVGFFQFFHKEKKSFFVVLRTIKGAFFEGWIEDKKRQVRLKRDDDVNERVCLKFYLIWKGSYIAKLSEK